MTEDTEADMPFLMEVETAAGLLIKGLVDRQSRIDFPWQLHAMFRVACRLPNRLYDRVISGGATNPFTWADAVRDAFIWVVGGFAVFLFARYSFKDADPAWQMAWHFAIPLMGLAAVILSGRLRRSAKVPVLIILMTAPLTLAVGILSWFGVW